MLPPMAGPIRSLDRGVRDPQWRSRGACPQDWAAHLARLHGGFFHTPAGLRIGAPIGEPAFMTLEADSAVVGLAAGVWTSCRLSRHARHFYAPTLPALSAAVPPEVALCAWRECLEARGAADATVDSYDAGVALADAMGPLAARRQEYVVSLTPGRAGLLDDCAETHRRHIRGGERAGWTLRALAGAEAMPALEAVRAVEAQRGWDLRRWCEDLEDLRRHDWGATVFTAWNRTTLLAAALVGWSSDRAYYVAGGSTPEGYRESAAAWLHWRIMTILAESGLTTYNLGGTSAAAADPHDTSHGLYRFKRGFGATIVACRGLMWRFGPAHLALHRAARWLSAPIRGFHE